MSGFTSELTYPARATFNAHKRYALKCLFSPDMTLVNIISSIKRKSNRNLIFIFITISLLATTSADGTAKIWRTSDFTCQYELKHDRLQNWVWDCAFTSDSVYLITGFHRCYLIMFVK